MQFALSDDAIDRLRTCRTFCTVRKLDDAGKRQSAASGFGMTGCRAMRHVGRSSSRWRAFEHKNYWLGDLDSGAERQLSDLPDNFTIGDFDIAPDGRSIVFDRVQANSDLVLIDRAR